jgi:hypothetical protein
MTLAELVKPAMTLAELVWAATKAMAVSAAMATSTPRAESVATMLPIPVQACLQQRRLHLTFLELRLTRKSRLRSKALAMTLAVLGSAATQSQV